MEQSVGCSKWYTEDEKHVAELLLDLHNSEPRPFTWTWGRTKKRSATRTRLPPPAFLQTLWHHGGAAPSLDAEMLAPPQTEAASPSTPLSVLPTESDENPNHPSFKKRSLKKRKGCNLESIEDLTKSKASLNEINNGSKSEYKNSTLEFGGSTQWIGVNGLVNPSNSKAQNKKQKRSQMEMQMPSMMLNQNLMCEPSRILKGKGVVVSDHATTSLPMPSSSSSGLGRVDGNQGPLALLDLNISPKEFTQMDSFQPLDETTANKDLKRAMAAQARQKRILIYRSKNPFVHCRSRSRK